MDRAAMLTLDKANAKPLHIQIEESILQKLESGDWAPGRLIPSENELSHIYGVSRTTVRNVITKLVQEGLLFRIPGKGTYVAEPGMRNSSPSCTSLVMTLRTVVRLTP